MKLPDNHAERLDRARLSLEGLAIGEALVSTVTGDGDCDTNCAMVGGIVAVYAGWVSIPKDWQAARERFDWEKSS